MKNDSTLVTIERECDKLFTSGKVTNYWYIYNVRVNVFDSNRAEMDVKRIELNSEDGKL